MFTLEIGGQPTAIMNVEEEDARAILESEGFKADLMRLRTDNAPLWDGQAPLNLRPSNEEEIAEFEESEEDEEEEEEEEDEDAATILFLVPLDEEEDEEGEEDDAE
ncbi:hypothetical protein [Roseomonas marmotae]|uniref:Uncharacterized protein n=1 Tax=Roseomonas marmotae TaxID=2768161 RepID=A0ABS3KIT0_9PROT|nr:hypothetical protein [Roseomonas marmotae]MBO1076880.1 hypothetical protein [Roseomonas marmotae]QTI81130.1 hypothetical protein IAI58_17350 [Roseomonas marmotae]